MSIQGTTMALLVTSLALGCAEEAHDPTAADLPPVPGTPGQAEPLERLSYLHGVWVGVATGTDPEGAAYTVRQTERVGPMLGGDVLVIEGRAYEEDDRTAFNALGVVSWNRWAGTYEMRSYARGYAGTYALELTERGYVWTIPAGPEGEVRFTATIEADGWHEVAEYTGSGPSPFGSFEMDLQRAGDTDWPAGKPVLPGAGD